MRVAVFGAGYVGSVTGACLAALGHEILFVEPSAEKTEMLRRGESPVSEPGLGELLAEQWAEGRIRVAAHVGEAVNNSDLGMICVGTPSRANGAVDPSQVERVVAGIVTTLREAPREYVVCLRSTLASSAIGHAVVAPLEGLGSPWGGDVVFAVNPEFMREGCAIQDFRRPSLVVIGTEHSRAEAVLRTLYQGVEAPVRVASVGSASLLKYACNSFHALKVAFANEVGLLEGVFDANAKEVMGLLCEDTRLNVSASYLRPGYAFGGSCLPKDLRAVNREAEYAGVHLPVLAAVLRSNEAIIQQSVSLVESLGHRQLALVGLSFKRDTDDLRESPLVEFAERLLGKGYDITVYDPDIKPSTLKGQNLQYVQERLGHLTTLLRDTIEETVRDRPLIVVGKSLTTLEELRDAALPGAQVIDLLHSLDPIEGLQVMRTSRFEVGPSVSSLNSA